MTKNRKFDENGIKNLRHWWLQAPAKTDTLAKMGEKFLKPEYNGSKELDVLMEALEAYSNELAELIAEAKQKD